MKLKNLKPWNWFKKEQESEASVSVVRSGELSPSNDVFGRIRRDMDKIFENRMREFGLPSLFEEKPLDAGMRILKPSIDIKETRKNYVVSVEMPGVDKDQVNVSIDGNSLTISGEKQQETKKDDENYHYVERSYGSFQRMLDLPRDANTDELDASFKKGVLTLKIGKSKEEKNSGRTVEIREEKD